MVKLLQIVKSEAAFFVKPFFSLSLREVLS